MSALEEFLGRVGDEKETHVVDNDGTRILYVTTAAFRRNLADVLNLVHYGNEIDVAIITAHDQPKVELRSAKKH